MLNVASSMPLVGTPPPAWSIRVASVPIVPSVATTTNVTRAARRCHHSVSSLRRNGVNPSRGNGSRSCCTLLVDDPEEDRLEVGRLLVVGCDDQPVVGGEAHHAPLHGLGPPVFDGKVVSPLVAGSTGLG